MGKSFKHTFPVGWTQVCLTRKAREATHSNAEKKEMVLHFSQSHTSYQQNGEQGNFYTQIISCKLISGLLCCALCMCSTFSTRKTPREALAASLLLASPGAVWTKLPETLVKNRWSGGGYFCSTEIFWGEPRKIFLNRGKCTMLINARPLLQGRWTNRTPCHTISTLVFWGTDATHRSCRTGSWVREKADPLKQRKKAWSRKSISQKQLRSCLPRTKVNRVFPPVPGAGNKAAHPAALVPRHLAPFQSTAKDCR